MALAIDASSPVRWTGTTASAAGDTSASFTAPIDSLLVCCVEYDSSNSPGAMVMNIADSGGLSWTKRVERTGAETTAGAGSAIFTARTTSAVARTVTVSYSAAGGVGTGRKSARIYVVTGADLDGTPVDTVGANNEGGSSTNNLTTTSITAGGAGLLFAADSDWNQRGVMTSADLTLETADYASEISVGDGYKAVASGASVNANFNAGGGAAAQHKWCQIIVREAAAAASGWGRLINGQRNRLVIPCM